MRSERSATPLAAIALLTAALAILPGCATLGPSEQEQDPMEGSNRAVFAFNDGLDQWLIEPLGRSWAFITPDVVPRSLDRLFDNLAFPRRFFACLLQGELVWSGTELGRFLVNTSLGIAGLLPMDTWLGIPEHDEDFGQTFGAWGIPGGAYWMLPFIGPANPRDTFGRVFDGVLNLTPGIALPLVVVNSRSLLIDEIEEAQAASLDYYVFVRNAYIQRRRAEVRNEPLPTTEEQEELYEAGDTPDAETE